MGKQKALSGDQTGPDRWSMTIRGIPDVLQELTR
jgi:hypothetical protein